MMIDQQEIFSVRDQVVCLTGSSRGLGKTLEPELQEALSELQHNAIAPGYLNNIMAGVVFDENYPYQRRIISRTLMHRRGNLEEFIGAYVFLSSNASSYVTGQITGVDGGYSCW